MPLSLLYLLKIKIEKYGNSSFELNLVKLREIKELRKKFSL